MKRGARIAANVFSLGLYGFIRKIVQNRKAINAGQERPHPVGELIGDAIGIAGKAALPAVKNDRVREALERASDAVDTIRDEPTPRESPSAKSRGLR